jgi:hypothetical protein
MSEAEDRWYVNVGSDDVRMMTLDELVDAFEKGTITRDTLVVEVGGNEWQPLREVADLGDEDPVPAAAPVQHAKPAAQTSWPPQAVSRDSAWPPASAWPSVMPASAASRTFSSAPVSAGPNSTIPVVQDLDFDIPPQQFKSGRKGVAVFAFLALAIAGGGAFMAVRGGMRPAMSPVPVPEPAAAPVKMPDPTPTPYSKTETTSASSDTTTASATKESDGRLSEDQKKALLSADKDRDVKKRTRAVAAPRSRGGDAPKSGGVFKATGNANDPLNPTL